MLPMCGYWSFVGSFMAVGDAMGRVGIVGEQTGSRGAVAAWRLVHRER